MYLIRAGLSRTARAYARRRGVSWSISVYFCVFLVYFGVAKTHETYFSSRLFFAMRQAVAAGEPPLVMLLNEINEINNNPLSQDLGETYHRDTHLTVHRAPCEF